MPSIHVRHAGVSREIPFEDIFTEQNLGAIGLTSATSPQSMSPLQIKELVSNFLDFDISDLDAYEIDFHKNLNITVRPEAEFGAKWCGTERPGRGRCVRDLLRCKNCGSVGCSDDNCPNKQFDTRFGDYRCTSCGGKKVEKL